MNDFIKSFIASTIIYGAISLIGGGTLFIVGGIIGGDTTITDHFLLKVIIMLFLAVLVGFMSAAKSS